VILSVALIMGLVVAPPALAAKARADVDRTSDDQARGGGPDQGACCGPGFCTVLPQDLCPFLWLGPFTVCGPVGTCCNGPTQCAIMAEACCEAGAGRFIGEPACGEMGVCCHPDGRCDQTLQGCCDGTFHTGQCQEPQACCFLEPGFGPSCKDMDPVCCVDLGGMPEGPGTVCLGDSDGDFIDDACRRCGALANGQGCSLTDCNNGPPTAICVPTCVEFNPLTSESRVLECACQDVESCQAFRQLPDGEPFCNGGCLEGEACFANRLTRPDGSYVLCCDCDTAEPRGACCAGVECFIATQAECADSNGDYGGDGSSCAGFLAPCCLPDGTCEMLDPQCCRQRQGVVQPTGTTCTEKEACCIPEPGTNIVGCKDLDPLCCDEAGGTALGPGTFCQGDSNGDNSDDACVPPVRYCPLPPSPAPGLCDALQQRDCQIDDPTNQFCLPRALIVLAGAPFVVDECGCFGTEDCGPIRVNPDTLVAFCPGPCPIPEDRCQVHVNGVPTGRNQIELPTLPPSSRLTCECAAAPHDPVRSALHDPANSANHDPVQSDVHDVVLSIVHVSADSTLHNPLTSVIHDVWWTNMHDAADSVLHDPAESILHDPEKSAIHEPLKSAVHSVWMSKNHDPLISDQHDGVTSGPHDVAISGVHDVVTTSLHVPLTSDIHDPHWTSMHDVGLSPQHDAAVSVVHRQVNSDQHKPLTTDIHDPWWTSMHDGATSETHDPVISPIHQQVASELHKPLTTDIHDPHWSGMHDPIQSEGHPAALSWVHLQRETALHNLLTSDVHDPWWTSMHDPGQSPIHDAAVSWVHTATDTSLHDLLTSDIHDPWWTSMHDPNQSPVHDPARSPIHDPRRTELHSTPFSFVHAPFMSPGHGVFASDEHLVGWSSIDHNPLNSHNPFTSIGHHPLISLQHTPNTSPIHGPVDSIIHEVSFSPVHDPLQSPIHIPGISPFHNPTNTAVHTALRSDIHDPVWTSMHNAIESNDHDPARSGVHKLPLSPGHFPLASVFHSPFMSANHDPIASQAHDPAPSVVHDPGPSIQHDPVVSALHSPLLSAGHVITTSAGHLPVDSAAHDAPRSVIHPATLSPLHDPVRSVLHSPLLSAGHVTTTSAGHLAVDSVVHDPARSPVHDPSLSVGHDVLTSVVHSPLMSAGHDPLISPVHDPARSAVHDAATSAQHDPLTSVFHSPVMSSPHIATTSGGHDPSLSQQHDPALSLVHDPASTSLHNPLTSLVHDPFWTSVHDPIASTTHDPAVSQIHDPIQSSLHDPVRSAVHSVLLSAPHNPLTSVGHFADQSVIHDPALSAVEGVTRVCPLPDTPGGLVPLCANVQQRDCVTDDPTNLLCLPKALFKNDAGQLEAEVCACFGPDGECGPIRYDAANGELFCPGPCPFAPDVCQVHFDGVPTGQDRISIANVPVGVLVTCDCAPPPPPVCPMPPGAPFCGELQQRDCQSDGQGDEVCLPRAFIRGDGESTLDECGCFEPGECGRIGAVLRDIEGSSGLLYFCYESECPTLSDECQIHLDGVPTGRSTIGFIAVPPGSRVTCDCAPPPIGACCLPSATGDPGVACENLTQAKCEERQGVYAGDGTNCAGTIDACCGPEGGCRMLDPVCCGLFEGTPELGEVCEGRQACCLDDGRCIDVDGLCCKAEHGGQPQGPESECKEPVKCCFPDGRCDFVDPNCCKEAGGVIAEGNSCEPEVGCCLPNGDCRFINRECCDRLGGKISEFFCQGEITGCCMPDGTCRNATRECCLAFGGEPFAELCSPPQACCLPLGVPGGFCGCIETDPKCCEAVGGEPQGPDRSCDDPNGVCDRGPFIVHGEGGPGETSPCTGYIDPRIENLDLNDRTPKLGVKSVVLVFSEPVFAPDGGEVKPAEFIVGETGGGVPPMVMAVSTSDNVEFKLELDRPITLEEWTTIQAVVVDACGNLIVNQGDLGPGNPEPDRVDYGFLPGDIDQNGETVPLDLIRFRQFIATGVNPNDCAAYLYYDIDRDGAFPLPLDLIRYRQILAGAPPATKAWLAESMNAMQP